MGKIGEFFIVKPTDDGYAELQESLYLSKKDLFKKLREKSVSKKETAENREIFRSVLIYSKQRGEKRKLKNQSRWTIKQWTERLSFPSPRK